MNIFRILHNWFIPHSGNNHRAKALHHDALFSYIFLFLLINLSIRFIHCEAPGVLGYATDIRVDQLLADTNAKRVQDGLPTLTLNGLLSQAAQAKAADMFADNYWAHNSPSGKTPWDFIVKSGYKYTLAGENLAKNFQTSSGVVDAWMASPSHRDNIMKNGYIDVGFAVVNGVLNGEETTLVVQMFGAPQSRSVAVAPKVQAQAPLEAPILLSEPAVTIAPIAPSAAPLLQQVGSNDTQSYISAQTFPWFNIPSVSRGLVYLFIGMLLSVLAIDAIVISRGHIVRLVGHNVAHIVFLISILAYSLFLTRGSLI
jgi:hypothetical protein